MNLIHAEADTSSVCGVYTGEWMDKILQHSRTVNITDRKAIFTQWKRRKRTKKVKTRDWTDEPSQKK